MLVLVYGLNRLKTKNEMRASNLIMVTAGLCFSLNMYMHLRIAIFAMLLGGGYIAWSALINRLWILPRFWAGIVIFALTAAITSAPLLILVQICMATLSTGFADLATLAAKYRFSQWR